MAHSVMIHATAGLDRWWTSNRLVPWVCLSGFLLPSVISFHSLLFWISSALTDSLPHHFFLSSSSTPSLLHLLTHFILPYLARFASCHLETTRVLYRLLHIGHYYTNSHMSI